MSEVAIATMPWGVVQDASGAAQAAAAYSITLVDNTLVANGFTNSYGEIPGTLPTGIYKVTVLGRTKIVHVFEADETFSGGALTGPITTPSFASDMATQAELDATVVKKFRTSHTWALGGPLTAGMFVPRATVPKLTNQAVQLVSIRAGIISGTSATVQLIRNGSNVGSTFSVTTTFSNFTPTGLPLTLADLDQIWFSITGATATPADMSFSAIFEHTVT